MFVPDAGRAASRELRRVGWLLHAHVVETKLYALREAVKTNFDPNQPRVPAGHGRESGRWTDAGGGTGGRLPSGSGTLLDSGGSQSERIRLAQNDSPDRESDVPRLPGARRRKIQSISDIPKEKPASRRLQNTVAKFVAHEVASVILARAELRGLIGAELRAAVSRVMIAMEVASWVSDLLPPLVSYSDPPRSLKELRDAVSHPRSGYEIHHIVEKDAAAKDGFPRSMVESRENLVRVPTFKHHEITGWFMTGNEDFGDLSPRNYLRGKDWQTRMRVGLDALIEYGVLKP